MLLVVLVAAVALLGVALLQGLLFLTQGVVAVAVPPLVALVVDQVVVMAVLEMAQAHQARQTKVLAAAVLVGSLHQMWVVVLAVLEFLSLATNTKRDLIGLNMAHYAKIEDGIVVEVTVAEKDFVDTLDGTWVQTSYNTHGGVHTLGGTPLRKNYAGIGMTYDATRNAFIPLQKFASWLLNETTCLWEPPVAIPSDDKKYMWDEDVTSWAEVT